MTNWPATIEILAASYWNETGILLDVGRVYNFVAEGRWMDQTICSGPDGNPHPVWAQRLLARHLRVRGQPDFTLIGALDNDPTTIFPIGGRLAGWTAPRTGQLSCFANDVPLMYWNNHGSVHLTVTPAA